jgi:hypothetical protein
MKTMNKAQTGATVKPVKKVVKPVKKVVKPTTKENVKKAIDKFKFKNLPTFETAQKGKTIKKTKISKQPNNMLIPGMGIPNSAPKKVETMSAKSGTKLKNK